MDFMVLHCSTSAQLAPTHPSASSDPLNSHPTSRPHCLRHTFASLLLQQGESPAYVQGQLDHASIQLTVDTYGAAPGA